MSEVKASGCPFHTQKTATVNSHWWPNKLNLKPLGKNAPASESTSYIQDLQTVDFNELKTDILNVMKTSQSWWPADYGHYGPFFVRMAWHSAGTYRTFDGRGGGGTGNLRFAPLNSWPDNGNLDKARRLLWPVKKKYGRKLSWGDLMLYTGHVALEDMGLPVFGFGFGRTDIWEPEEDIYWGQEKKWLEAGRGGLGDALEQPLGAVQMGLIYVNPEGPGGNPDPLQSAQDIRTTFGRMAMNDEETVALIAGGHTFGKAHGAADPSKYVGPEPEGAPIEEQGLGWKNSFNSGRGVDTITSGLEGAWTAKPTQWDNGYFENLMKYEWVQTKSPAGATQWVPADNALAGTVPDAHDSAKSHAPIMFTTDLALKLDPVYGPISKRFHDNPADFADAFARAWYKLTHRDMGPRNRLVGPFVPPAQLWQDPVPEPTADAKLSEEDVASFKKAILALGLPVGQLVAAAWSSASTFRCTDYRGGANGARVRLAPQNQWACNDPATLKATLDALQTIPGAGSKISMADLIVLAGCAAVESAAPEGTSVPFSAGRTDATQEQTDAATFDVLEPVADGFRNYVGPKAATLGASAEAILVDRACMLSLTKSELTVLVGGMRVLGANAGGSSLGVFTATPGKLTTDFFVNLTDLDLSWAPSAADPNVFEGKTSAGDVKWTGSRADLVFGSNSELRALAEYYACDDAKENFVSDFVAAWGKVMNLDRFDL